MTHWTKTDLPRGACREAVEWCQTQPDLATAWRVCKRGDWMLWLAGRRQVDRRTLVLAACDCAELALIHVLAGEDRPRIAIETARAWARGEATIEQVRAAAYAATRAAASAASAAAYAADAAARAAASAAASAAALSQCADIVRRYWPEVPV